MLLTNTFKNNSKKEFGIGKPVPLLSQPIREKRNVDPENTRIVKVMMRSHLRTQCTSLGRRKTFFHKIRNSQLTVQ